MLAMSGHTYISRYHTEMTVSFTLTLPMKLLLELEFVLIYFRDRAKWKTLSL